MDSEKILPRDNSEAFDDLRSSGMGTAPQEEFIAELIGFLRKNYPDDLRFVEDELLEKRVRWGIDRARRHHLTWAYSISNFVTMMVVAGARFDEDPAVRACLDDPSVPPDERIDLMFRTITDGQWDELRQNSRQRDWTEADTLPDRDGRT